jgi:hypothetical protein
MLLLLCCALNREYTMRQPLKHSCHKDLEKVSGSEGVVSLGVDSETNIESAVKSGKLAQYAIWISLQHWNVHRTFTLK